MPDDPAATTSPSPLPEGETDKSEATQSQSQGPTADETQMRSEMGPEGEANAPVAENPEAEGEPDPLAAEREALAELDPGVCLLCGGAKKLQMVHLLGEALGPVAICKRCRKARGDRPLEAWLRHLRDQDQELWQEYHDHNAGEVHPLAQLLWKLEEENCDYCGSKLKLLPDPREAQLESPRMICARCNLSRGDKEEAIWLDGLKAQRSRRWNRIAERHRERESPVRQHLMGEDRTEVRLCLFCGSAEELSLVHLKVELTGAQVPVTVCQTCSRSQAMQDNQERFKRWFGYLKHYQADHWSQLLDFHRERQGGLSRLVHQVQGGRFGADARCVYCGSDRNLRSNHRVYPDQKPEPACASCHMSRKSDKDLKEWLRYTKAHRPRKWQMIVDHNRELHTKLARKVQKIARE